MKMLTQIALCISLASCATQNDVQKDSKANEIEKTIATKREEYRNCFTTELNKNKNQPNGKIMISFEIQRTGNPTKLVIESSTLNNPKIDICILKIVESLKFNPQTEVIRIKKFPFKFDTSR